MRITWSLKKMDDNLTIQMWNYISYKDYFFMIIKVELLTHAFSNGLNYYYFLKIKSYTVLLWSKPRNYSILLFNVKFDEK